VSPVAFVAKYVRRYWRSYVIGLLCLAAGNAVGLTGPLVVRFIVDGLTNKTMTASKLPLYAGAILLIAVCSGVFRFFSRRLTINASRNVEYDIRNDYFGHVLRLSRSFFRKMMTGDVMSRATNDLGHVRMFVGPGIMHFAGTAFVVPAAAALMFAIHVRLAAICLMLTPLLSVAVYFLGRAVHSRMRKVQEQYATVNSTVQENLAGIRVVKAYTREAEEEKKFGDECSEYMRRNLRLARLDSIFHPLLHFIIEGSIVILLWFGGRWVIRGELSLGDFTAVMMYLMHLLWPVAALGWVVNLYQRSSAAIGRMNQVLLTEPDIADTDLTQPVDSIKGEIEFRNVSLAYNGRDAVHGINFKIKPGQKVAIVGPTASGKTTLASLIPRLYDPTEGQVLIDGVDARRLPLATLRSHVGFVPQETFLFSNNIGWNIALGLKERDETVLRQSADASRILEAIEEFPDRFDTMLGERGVNLSGGQKQRIAISRALAVDPRILVLDDCLSSVDTQTEEEILQRLKDYFVGRTCIVISHRISAVKDSDMIVVLDEGRIAETGTHETLLEQEGIYWKMYRTQLLEEEIAES